jgi:hypothetical protein
MKKHRNLTIGTLVANLFILIGAGHGVGPIGFIEVFGFSSYFFNQPILFSGSYDDTIPVSLIISLIGQVLLFLSLFNLSHHIKIYAIALLWIGFAYLIHNIVKGDELSRFSFWSGTPFLICSIILFTLTINNTPKEVLTD